MSVFPTCQNCESPVDSEEPPVSNDSEAIVEQHYIPIPLKNHLYMAGYYTPFAGDWQSILLEFKEHGLNGVRIFLDNPWQGYGLYEDNDWKIPNEQMITRVRKIIEYANSIGMIVQIPIFNCSALRMRGWYRDFYDKENWIYHRNLVRTLTCHLEGLGIIYEIDNEGYGGYPFEIAMRNELLYSGISKQYITSSAYRDSEDIKREFKLFCLHNSMLKKEFDRNISSLNGKKWIFSTDGNMDGSSNIAYQEYGNYPTPDELKDWIGQIKDNDSNLEFNFSGLIEDNNHQLPKNAYRLLKAIKKELNDP